MACDLDISCDCGRFRGVLDDVTPDAGNHVTCYCDDCQVFQHLLGAPERVLDANGGTAIFQMSGARLRITSGAANMACVRLSPNGILRWYASCCDAAIGNTLASPALPFVGVITAIVRRANDPAATMSAFGPMGRGVFGRFAYGDMTTVDAHDRAPLSALLRFLRLAMGWRWRGDHRRVPLFDAQSRAPIVEPRVLGKDERAQLEQRRQAFAAARGA